MNEKLILTFFLPIKFAKGLQFYCAIKLHLLVAGGWTSYIGEQSIGVKKWAEQLCPCPRPPPPGLAPSSIRSV